MQGPQRTWRETVDRFWSLVDVQDADSCWIWLGATDRKGYGTFYVGHRGIAGTQAHRFSLMLQLRRRLRLGECALHKCDNPPCCNPNHLFSGSNADNCKDRHAKGRTARVCGEMNHMSKLSDAQRIEVRNLYAAGGVTMQQIADRFGVSQGVILRCVESKPRTETAKRGAENGNSKLTAAQVMAIRDLYDGSRGCCSRLARQFGVHRSTIVDIVDRTVWAWL